MKQTELPPPSRTSNGVIDFELSTGFRLGVDGACGNTWAEKARVLAYIVKALARIHTITINGARTTLQKALRPRGDVPSLTPLGAPVTSGYGRRPKWVSDKTPQVVAYNVWRAREAERRTRTLAGHATKPNARNRMFAKKLGYQLRGLPCRRRMDSAGERGIEGEDCQARPR